MNIGTEWNDDATREAAYEYRAWLAVVNVCPTCGRRDDYADVDEDDGTHLFQCSTCDAQWHAFPEGPAVLDRRGTIKPSLYGAGWFRLGYQDGRSGRDHNTSGLLPLAEARYRSGYSSGVRDMALDVWLDDTCGTALGQMEHLIGWDRMEMAR